MPRTFIAHLSLRAQGNDQGPGLKSFLKLIGNCEVTLRCMKKDIHIELL